MQLWLEWMALVNNLRGACSRQRTFFWMIIALIGFTIKFDHCGVTSLARGVSLLPSYYTSLLHVFYSSAINLGSLRTCWINLVIRHFTTAVIINGRHVIAGDGIKIGKEGKKMPGVKSLHQDSDSNSKAEFIMGHSIQVVAMIIKGLGSYFAVPLTGEIHEGFKFNSKDKRTLLDKMVEMINNLNVAVGFYVVLDKYYCAGKLFKKMIASGNHVITMMKTKAVAYYPPDNTSAKKGRPRKYGEKVKLFDLFKSDLPFIKASMPNNENIIIEYYVIELLWKPLGQLVKFVLVRHPIRGNSICLSTDLTLDPLSIILIYCLRFKIEVTFKSAVHQIGTFMYHFWIKHMMPTKRCSKGKILQFAPAEFKEKVKRKLNAYHLFIQLGCIAQGLMQFLSVNYSRQIWSSFGGWLRTIRSNTPPSEKIVSLALQNTFGTFLIDQGTCTIFKKFILSKIDFSQVKFNNLEISNAA